MERFSPSLWNLGIALAKAQAELVNQRSRALSARWNEFQKRRALSFFGPTISQCGR